MTVERMTAAELRAEQAKPAQGNVKRVQGAQRVTVNGITFDSKREAKRYSQLLLLERAGLIKDLKLQVSFDLMGQNGPIMTDGGKRVRRYVADFTYFDNALGVTVIEDAKGHATEVYKIKKRILEAMGYEVDEV